MIDLKRRRKVSTMYKGEMRMQSNNALFECSLSTLEVALYVDVIEYFKIDDELQSCSFFNEGGKNYIRVYRLDKMILDDGSVCDIIKYFDFEITDVILSKNKSHTLTVEFSNGDYTTRVDMTFDADIPLMTKEDFDEYATRILKDRGLMKEAEG